MTNVYAIDEIDNLDLKEESWEPAYTVDFAPEKKEQIRELTGLSLRQLKLHFDQ